MRLIDPPRVFGPSMLLTIPSVVNVLIDKATRRVY
jgi:hypothetical protein